MATLLLLLAIPAPEPAIQPAPSSGRPFRWDRDSLWQSLERAFVAARADDCRGASGALVALDALEDRLDALQHTPMSPAAASLDTLESNFFALAPIIAACPAPMDRFIAAYAALRQGIKWQSRNWDVTTSAARDRIYRALYGSRAAIEEVMLQHPDRVTALLHGTAEPSVTPSAMSHGVELRSGDILVSRGGYPTSALIARGNDYPGNFSHVGLVHIDDSTGAVSVVEAHIELGVVVASAERYLADKKLRLMVLRPRADLPLLQRDPMLPHVAATSMRDRARSGHIPYDFSMDYRDPSRLFCSEVASAAYASSDITLWAGISTISREGLRRWLGSFGVRHFETQEPSDLEYDPQLLVVAEWRDPQELFRDHIDNAVTDAMLEGADRGDRLTYAWYQLPLARLAKGYSLVRERFGSVGPIPQGMSAAAALRNRAYGARHALLAARVGEVARAWQEEHGYPPAYWTLVELGRDAVGDERGSTSR
jgi:hypothetical protein